MGERAEPLSERRSCPGGVLYSRTNAAPNRDAVARATGRHVHHIETLMVLIGDVGDLRGQHQPDFLKLLSQFAGVIRCAGQ